MVFVDGIECRLARSAFLVISSNSVSEDCDLFFGVPSLPSAVAFDSVFGSVFLERSKEKNQLV